MEESSIINILQQIKEDKISISEGLDFLKKLPYEDLGFAKIDHHRKIRRGYPEVVFCQNKTSEQIVVILKSFLEKKSNILATRVSSSQVEEIKKLSEDFIYNDVAKICYLINNPVKQNAGYILAISAGTSDLPILEEAYITATILGNNVIKLVDVGVAGIHRLFDQLELIRNANIIIVVAGMEGALASVVGGLVDKIVIAVPTSVGYGANFGGLSALLTMLNSCVPGILTVNIDNGFGAGYSASIINKYFNKL